MSSSSSSSSRKRRRTSPSPSPGPSSVAPPSSTTALLAPLNHGTVRELLLAACKSYPEVYTSVLASISFCQNQERKVDHNFSEHVQTAWRALNPNGGRRKPPPKKKKKQGEEESNASPLDGLTSVQRSALASEISETIRSLINTITSQVHTYSSYFTKESALSTLRKIGKTLALSDAPVATVVRSYELPMELAVAMRDGVLVKMSEEERREAGEGEEKLVLKMRELVKLWEEGEMEGLEVVKEVLERLEISGRGDEAEEEEKEEAEESGLGGQEVFEIVSDDEDNGQAEVIVGEDVEIDESESQSVVVDLRGKGRR